ncbi:hypothetical protein LTR37_009242 [Vermiconidia calcicola]|uniref:Uncharacterized protein n=1 Tax=Vermiconidia calcicola TaxID=1690605 RepID=A0ACC3N8I4_9PEZI|nr:hypothetical protein LTR37_009242 [Vermiconidia calcicola]
MENGLVFAPANNRTSLKVLVTYNGILKFSKIDEADWAYQPDKPDTRPSFVLHFQNEREYLTLILSLCCAMISQYSRCLEMRCWDLNSAEIALAQHLADAAMKHAFAVVTDKNAPICLDDIYDLVLWAEFYLDACSDIDLDLGGATKNRSTRQTIARWIYLVDGTIMHLQPHLRGEGTVTMSRVLGTSFQGH